MGLLAKAADVANKTVDMQTTTMATKLVYGTQGSLMVATRPAGYHSRPHHHDCEQLNYLQDGELWIFIEHDAFLLRPGDFMRIPPGKIHWSWNKGTGSCTLIEVHCPGLQDDPLLGDSAVPLFSADEPASTTGSPRNEFIDYDPRPAEAKTEGPRE